MLGLLDSDPSPYYSGWSGLNTGFTSEFLWNLAKLIFNLTSSNENHSKFRKIWVVVSKIVKWKWTHCFVEVFQVVLNPVTFMAVIWKLWNENVHSALLRAFKWYKQTSCSLEAGWCGHIQTSNSFQDLALYGGFKFQGKASLTRSRSHSENTCICMEHAHPTCIHSTSGVTHTLGHVWVNFFAQILILFLWVTLTNMSYYLNILVEPF